jgi:hypothetical protein
MSQLVLDNAHKYSKMVKILPKLVAYVIKCNKVAVSSEFFITYCQLIITLRY